jgi:hypothetical protein
VYSAIIVISLMFLSASTTNLRSIEMMCMLEA